MTKEKVEQIVFEYLRSKVFINSELIEYSQNYEIPGYTSVETHITLINPSTMEEVVI